MIWASANPAGRRNHLLGALGQATRERIGPHLEVAEFKPGEVVCDAGARLQHAYFPDDCVLSLVTVLEDGDAIETANIGPEGAFGLLANRYGRVSFNRCIVQMEGRILRCRTEVLHAAFNNSDHARDLFLGYSAMLLAQVQQTVACNTRHSVRQRMCRWLLAMHDRTEGKPLVYTHEHLAQILGANRKSVTLAAQSMQDAGLIRYRRGTIEVSDRGGLEQAACECYAVVKNLFRDFHAEVAGAAQGGD